MKTYFKGIVAGCPELNPVQRELEGYAGQLGDADRRDTSPERAGSGQYAPPNACQGDRGSQWRSLGVIVQAFRGDTTARAFSEVACHPPGTSVLSDNAVLQHPLRN